MPTFIMGDVHGQLDKLLILLKQSGLVSASAAWSGADASLYFLGDYVDRGPDGLGVIDLVMRLQVEAAMARGRVEGLLGNHDVMLLAARTLGNMVPEGEDLPLRYLWQQNGGRKRDLDGLTEAHISWLSELPAMVMVGETLLQHADSTFYETYGATPERVSNKFAAVLESDEYELWKDMIVSFVRRTEFVEAKDGGEAAAKYLRHFKAKRLVHGHTPIPMVARASFLGPVTAPWVYAGGLCTNVDGGLFMGEPGFIYELLPISPPE